MNISSSSVYQPTQSSSYLTSTLPTGRDPLENPGSVLKPVEETQSPRRNQSAVEAQSPVADASPSSEETSAKQAQLDAQQEQIEQQQIDQLSARDREVRNHERAHAAVGGQYAGAPRYQYERGPDGVSYAVSGEVSISAGPVSGNPQATIDKAQIVRRAALAPAEPSAQDRSVAAQATQMEAQARVELSVLEREERLAEGRAMEERVERQAEDSVATDSVDNINSVTSYDGSDVQPQNPVDETPLFNRLSNQLEQGLLNSSPESQPASLGSIVSRYA
ncbi:MAG: putative metalloprotease CJM1_0395 family protein [Cellvibrionaceae bacterium]